MKFICVEEHFMSKKVNDTIKEIIKPNTELEKARNNFTDTFVCKS